MVPVNPTPSTADFASNGSSSAGHELLATLNQRIRRIPPLATLYDALTLDSAAAPLWAVGGVLRDLLHDPSLPLREIDLTIEVDDPAATTALARAVAARTGATIHTHDAFGTASLELQLGPVGSTARHAQFGAWRLLLSDDLRPAPRRTVRMDHTRRNVRSC